MSERDHAPDHGPDPELLLRHGASVRALAGAILGDGWWRGQVGATSVRNVYGTKLALLLQIHALGWADEAVEAQARILRAALAQLASG